MEFNRTKHVGCHLDIAPLIDIVFLLLIFFMLTANFIINPGLTISLPNAQSATPQDTENVFIFISMENEVYLDDLKVDVGDLQQLLKTKIEKYPEKKVILKADEQIDFGLAVKVMDIAKQAGSENFAIATNPKEEKHEKLSGE